MTFKNIRFFVIFSSKIPLVFQCGAALKAPTFSEGPLLKPPIFNSWWQIYTPPPTHTHTHTHPTRD